jgi:hypothetical protein
MIAKAKENGDFAGTAKHQEEIFGSAIAFAAHLDQERLALVLALAINRLAQIATFTFPAAAVALPHGDR